MTQFWMQNLTASVTIREYPELREHNEKMLLDLTTIGAQENGMVPVGEPYLLDPYWYIAHEGETDEDYWTEPVPMEQATHVVLRAEVECR